MKHPEELKRLFTKPDEEVLQQSDVKLNSFQENKEAFVARFPQLADPFAEEWGTTTNTARGFIPDFETVNEQANETQILDSLMEDGRNHFQTVILYVQLAFPNDSAVLRLFGQPQYHAARNSQLKLPVLLRSMYNQASKDEYKKALLSKGLKVEEIEMLNGLAENIVEQDIAQQKAKKARSMAASARIETMNAVWEKMAMVCQCAKLVFQNDAARYNLFLLTDAEAPKKEDVAAPAASN
jgi:hypothetical protein